MINISPSNTYYFNYLITIVRLILAIVSIYGLTYSGSDFFRSTVMNNAILEENLHTPSSCIVQESAPYLTTSESEKIKN